MSRHQARRRRSGRKKRLPLGKHFASAKAKRIELPKAESWVEIRYELNRSENDKVISAGLLFSDGESGKAEAQVNRDHMNRVKLETWLVSWGLEDEKKLDDGTTVPEPVPLSRHAIDALQPDVAEEILDAIEAWQEQLAEEKKAQTGEKKPEPVSA